MAGFAMLMTAAGTVMSMMSQRAAMKQQADMANYNAARLREQAIAQDAAASQAAEGKMTEAHYRMSEAQAQSGHSGGGAVPDIVSRIYGQGLVNSGNEVAQGRIASTATRAQAALQDYSAKATRDAIPGAMILTGVSGVGKMAQIGAVSGYSLPGLSE